jgi:hypothetical protein
MRRDLDVSGLGIDPAQTFPNDTGRPMYILDDREPVKKLL